MSNTYLADIAAVTLKVIRRFKREGTVGAGLITLKNAVISEIGLRHPVLRNDMPLGTNAGYVFTEQFEGVVNGNKAIKAFVLT